MQTSLRHDAKDKLEGAVAKSARKRSQQRRRLELGGEKEIDLRPEHFKLRGALEEVLSDASAMDSKTESIANSSIYHELAADMDGFNTFISQAKKRELETTQRTTKRQG